MRTPATILAAMVLALVALAPTGCSCIGRSRLDRFLAEYHGYLTDPYEVDLLCRHTNRLVITRAEAVETEWVSDPPGSTRRVVSHVTFTVLRQVNVGPQVRTFTADYPGGRLDGFTAELSGYPVVDVGTTLALGLNYVDDDFSSKPYYVEPVFEIPHPAFLPSDADLDAAYAEICRSAAEIDESTLQPRARM